MSSRKNPTSRSSRIKIGITIGDPSGIGPAITVKSLNKLRSFAQFVVIGDSTVLNMIPGFSDKKPFFRLVDLKNIDPGKFKFGRVKADYGRASIEYLFKALELIKSREIDCLVTAPISKEAINLAGYNYSGHTGFLTRQTHSKDTVMMLLNRDIKFSLLTQHIPLSRVSGAITKGLIRKNVILTCKALRGLFGIERPKIVLCGINPHASDNGVIGKEEGRNIIPALKGLAKELKATITGPISADVAIKRAKEDEFDCVIAAYHDQALIPLKLFSAKSGVNLTIGLPFIRTSPLHGTAFDIAADPKKADPGSMISAIKLALKCCQNQKKD